MLINECLQIAVSYRKVCIKHILVVLVQDTFEIHGQHFLVSSSLLLSVCEAVKFTSCLLISGLYIKVYYFFCLDGFSLSFI